MKGKRCQTIKGAFQSSFRYTGCKSNLQKGRKQKMVSILIQIIYGWINYTFILSKLQGHFNPHPDILDDKSI